jgi:hypothetical protein
MIASPRDVIADSVPLPFLVRTGYIHDLAGYGL